MDELIAPWMGYASIPMYDDEVITWWANKKSTYFPKVVDELEKDLGINFERVDLKRDAEIRHKRVKKINGYFSTTLGQAQWHPSDRIWKLKTRQGEEYNSTVIHELGHALGLGHPQDHQATTNTVMSYGRDRTIQRFFYRDLDIFNNIYINRDYVLQDVEPKKVKIDMVTGDCHNSFLKSHHATAHSSFDVLTGINHSDYI
tara:strand:- start:766 stop:1368 length:603 start_codon:yes stop_codon:yes gene_type:complete